MHMKLKSSTTINRKARAQQDLVHAIHPGRTILEDYLEPLEMSVNKLAHALAVPANRLNEIVHGRRGITADTALRLARYLGTSPQFWMNLQATYELKFAALEAGKVIEKTVKPRDVAA
jgi:addiction module HigA family antidote